MPRTGLRPTGVLEAIGSTPLVELHNVERALPFQVYAKLEGLNPGGSLKDRAALGMMLDKIDSGEVRPGLSTVIESSSGNLGIGLAQVCRYFGLRLVCVVDARTTTQHIAVLRAFGAEVEVVTEPDLATGEYQAARIGRVHELVEQVPHAYWPNQYANLLNARAHQTTMREIVEDMAGDVDYVFCATSSCGTLRGCADYGRTLGSRPTIVAVDATGSAIFGQSPVPRLLPGHGASVRPDLYRADLADRVVHVSDLECVVACRALVMKEAILAGGSSGAVVAALRKVQGEIPPGSRCALILPDRGERYLDTIYDDTWVLDKFGQVSHRWMDDEGESTSC